MDHVRSGGSQRQPHKPSAWFPCKIPGCKQHSKKYPPDEKLQLTIFAEAGFHLSGSSRYNFNATSMSLFSAVIVASTACVSNMKCWPLRVRAAHHGIMHHGLGAELPQPPVTGTILHVNKPQQTRHFLTVTFITCCGIRRNAEHAKF